VTAKKPWLTLIILIVFSSILIFQSVTAGRVLANQGLPGSNNDPLVSKGFVDSYIGNSFASLKGQLAGLEKQLGEVEQKVTTLADKLVPYQDIKGHWAQRDITFLYNKKIVTGFEDGTFRPSDRVTRVQLAVMLVRAKGLPLGDAGKDFKDVPTAFWANKEITAARKAGIIGGYPDGTFGPARQVTRQEIAAMMARAFPLETGDESTFKDIDNSWAKADIVKLAGAGIIGGYEDNTFRPVRTATRAEISAILARALDPARRLQR